MGACRHTDNRRQAKRYRAQHVAKIVLGPESMISCMVEDISTGGARIALACAMDLPDDFDLFIAAHEVQVHHAHVCWRQDDFAGVSFIPIAARAEQTRSFTKRTTSSYGAFRNELERVRVEVEREDTNPRVFTRRISG